MTPESCAAAAGSHPQPAESRLRMPADVAARLVCPHDGHAPLLARDGVLVCADPACARRYPVHDGMPVLINEQRSMFRLAEFQSPSRTTLDLRPDHLRLPSLASRIKSWLVARVPKLSVDSSDFNVDAAIAAIEAARPEPTILVVGAGDQALRAAPGTRLVYSDVAWGALTDLIVDAQDLPFANASFDAYVSVAVLQYLPDPWRAAEQAHRVLKPDGLVYVVAPFMQQNTLGPHDFFLFTHTGLRRVFNHFDELRSGVANGPAMALSWSIEQFMTSFSDRRWVRSVLSNLTRLLIWPVKYLDGVMSRHRGAYDGASAFYFFGRRAEQPVDDRRISNGYRGLKWHAVK